MEEFILVEDLDEVKRNIIIFNKEIKENEVMRKRFLSHFRQWYYISELDMYAPSKFIGYKNMTAARYNNKDGMGADGRKTEAKLQKWFVKKEIHSLLQDLQDRFAEYGKIKESSEIHILKGEEPLFMNPPVDSDGISKGINLFKIPPLEPVERSREYNLYSDLIRDRVVYESLFHGRTRRWLDENVIGLNPDESRGYQAMGILHYIGLKDKHKGIFKDLSLVEAIQLLDKQESDFSLVLSSLRRYENESLKIMIPPTETNIKLTETEKEQVIKSRVGQSAFKKELLLSEKKCNLCGVSDERFLIASHIKPWSKSDHQERLDVNNGLLLCPNHDSLFDKGYISFGDDGAIMISDTLDEATRVFLNINETMNIAMNERRQRYIEWHRENIFKTV